MTDVVDVVMNEEMLDVLLFCETTEIACGVQVLMATDLKRTDSVLTPGLFTFQEHFDFLSIIGKTPQSEVSLTRIGGAHHSD